MNEKEIIAQPGELTMFIYEGNLPPTQSDLFFATGNPESVQLFSATRARSEVIKEPFVYRSQHSHRGGRFVDCFSKCIMDQLGIRTIIELVAVGTGAPIIKKRFVTPGSSLRTSLASKYLAKALPHRLSRPVIAPTTVKLLAKSPVLGRVIGRWIPFVGWGLLGYDAIKIAQCTANCIKR